jgi:ParB-like chromosome segregation protein Spo0J
MANTTRKITEIKIGTRHRKDMGDIQAFADNIKAVGLLHPVVINKSDELIAGARRIRAYELLGETEIPVTVVDLGAIVHGEFAENEQRKDFTPSEAVQIQRAVGPLFKAEAKERQAVGGKLKGKAGAKLAQPAKGKTRDKIAKYTGIKRTSLKKAEAIVAASEAEPDNQQFAGLVKEMDTTGKIDGAYQQLRAAQDQEAKPPKPATNSKPATSKAVIALIVALKQFEKESSKIDIELAVSGLNPQDRATAERQIKEAQDWLGKVQTLMSSK